MDIRETRMEDRYQAAYRALLALCVLVVVHTSALMLTAPEDRLTPINVIGTVVLNAIAIAAFAWLAFSVRGGRRVRMALVCAIVYGLTWLTAIGVVAVNGLRYTGALPLLAVQIVLAFIYTWAVWTLVAVQR